MKIFRLFLYAIVITGGTYLLYINISHKTLSIQNLNALQYCNTVLEDEYQLNQSNRWMLYNINKEVTDGGHRTTDVEVLNNAVKSFLLYSKATSFLDSIKANDLRFPQKIDSFNLLKNKLTSTLDSLLKLPNMDPVEKSIRENHLLKYNVHTYKDLLNSSIVIQKHLLSRIETEILKCYYSKVWDCRGFDGVVVKLWPVPKETIAGEPFEANVYLTSKRQIIPYKVTIDYGETKEIFPLSRISFIAKADNTNGSKPIQKKWKAIIECIDTTYVVETSYTVKPRE